MSDSMRHALAAYDYRPLLPNVHAGLWFDRFVEGQPPAEGQATPEEQRYRASLVRECSEIREPELYTAYYDRWLDMLDRLGVQLYTAKVVYRLAAGHGGKGVTEAGIRLHHTYGVPVIPGSSLKGMAAAYARQSLSDSWKKGSDAYTAFFGTTDAEGYVTFFDALPLPGQWRLLPDVLTVHHRDYYTGSGAAPSDWDSPTPNPFPSATGTFLIGLRLPQRWAETGYELLRRALRELGVGGKTTSGYGRMELSANALRIPRLKAGATLNAVVEGVVGGDVTLRLTDSPLLDVPAGVRLSAYIPSEDKGNKAWAAGQKVRCVVTEVVPDLEEEPPVLLVICRPA